MDLGKNNGRVTARRSVFCRKLTTVYGPTNMKGTMNTVNSTVITVISFVRLYSLGISYHLIIL